MAFLNQRIFFSSFKNCRASVFSPDWPAFRGCSWIGTRPGLRPYRYGFFCISKRSPLPFCCFLFASGRQTFAQKSNPFGSHFFLPPDHPSQREGRLISLVLPESTLLCIAFYIPDSKLMITKEAACAPRPSFFRLPSKITFSPLLLIYEKNTTNLPSLLRPGAYPALFICTAFFISQNAKDMIK